MTSSALKTARLTVRPRRSMLYMPASNARALEKAKTLAADGLIFDLEDAVMPDAKTAARAAAVAAANTKAYGKREVLIRANASGTPWCDADVAAAAASGADGVVLPKVNGLADIQRAETILQNAPPRFALWAMMETPRGILAAEAIASGATRLAGFIVGTADLAKDLHCAHPRDRGTMLYALQHCVLVARAHGLGILDGVHFDLEDDAGLAAVCAQGRALGFDGKTLLHPRQIDAANTAFAPSPAALEHAARVIAAHAEAVAKGQGVTVLDGRLVEVLHVAEANHLLAQGAAIAALEK